MTKVETAEQTVLDAEQTIRDLIDQKDMWLQRGELSRWQYSF